MKLEHNSRNILYREPFGAVTVGTKVTLRLAAAELGVPKSIKLVTIVNDTVREIEMYYVHYICQCSYYEAVIDVGDKPGLIWYYFKAEGYNETMYYGNNHMNLGGTGCMYDHEPEFSYQITVYEKDYETPDWFKNSIAYQIFVDRFYNPSGEIRTDRKDIIKRKWGEVPYYKAEQFGGEYLANDFFGGTLEGVRKKLPYLADLGIGAIYLNPIFQAFSNHKYDTGDYKKIDPMFGTEGDFVRLCKDAAKLGIRIILDGVFNHTGSDSKYFNKNGTYDSIGATQSKKSKYYSWYRFMHYPDVYESWWGMTTLPQVEEKSESFRGYILHDKEAVVKYWLEKGASGWRLDVVDELPGFFVKELNKEVKGKKKDAVIIGEVWEDASNKVSYGERREYFLGHELDSVMNYPLRNMLIDFAMGRIDAQMFDKRLMSLKENYPKPAFYALFNMLSSHDIERILTILGNVPDGHYVNKNFQANFRLSGSNLEEAKRRLRAVVAMQMLLPGVPCIYYGDEVGMQGYGDPFCRGTYPWGKENTEIRDIYKKYINIRNNNSVFRTGELETVYKYGTIYAFMRSEDMNRKLVVVNMSDNFETVRVDLARFFTDVLVDEDNNEVMGDSGIFLISVAGYTANIYDIVPRETQPILHIENTVE